MALGTGWKEIKRSFDRGSTDADYWTGVRRYVGPRGPFEVTSYTHLSTATWTTPELAVMIPRKVTVHEQSRQGGSSNGAECSEIEVLYRTSYNPSTHPLGSATLAVSAQPIYKRAKYDKDGLVVEGVLTTDDRFFYKVVKGDNVKIESRSIVVIRTAIAIGSAQDEWDTILARVNKINSDSLPKLGMAAGQLLLVAAAVPRYYLYNSAVLNVPLNYVFWYETKGWNTIFTEGTDKGTCISQKFIKATKQIKLIDAVTDVATVSSGSYTYVHKDTGASGASAADAKLVIRTVDKVAKMEAADNSGARPLYDTDTFNDLVGLLWWTV